jgi:trigger factor
VDEQESDSWVDARNKGLAAALSELVDVEVPDTLITNQAKEKYAVMMTDFRDQ